MGYKPTVFEKIHSWAYDDIRYSELRLKRMLSLPNDITGASGAEIKCGVEVGKDVTIDELKKQGYKAFIIAIGCQGGKRPGVKNDDAKGTAIAVEYLRYQRTPRGFILR